MIKVMMALHMVWTPPNAVRKKTHIQKNYIGLKD